MDWLSGSAADSVPIDYCSLAGFGCRVAYPVGVWLPVGVARIGLISPARGSSDNYSVLTVATASVDSHITIDRPQ